MGNRSNALADIPLTYQPYLARHAYAKILLDQGCTYREIQRLTGTSPPTIARIKRGELIPNRLMTDALQRAEESKLTGAIHAILDGSITAEKIEAASLQQGVTSAAILVDKRELLAGRATARVGQELTDEAIEARLATLRQQAMAEAIHVEAISSVDIPSVG